MKTFLTLAITFLLCVVGMAQRANKVTVTVTECIDPVTKIVMVQFGTDKPREVYLYNVPRYARFKPKAKRALMKQARLYKRIERYYR